MPAHLHIADHPLNAPCSCGHAMWLHTTQCLVLKSVGGNRKNLTRCGCEARVEEFAS